MNTCKFSDYVARRAGRSPRFRDELVNAALDAMLAGETEVGLSMLRDAVKAETTFPELARRTGLNEKSLYRALSPKGNPTIRTLSKVRRALVGA